MKARGKYRIERNPRPMLGRKYKEEGWRDGDTITVLIMLLAFLVYWMVCIIG